MEVTYFEPSNNLQEHSSSPRSYLVIYSLGLFSLKTLLRNI